MARRQQPRHGDILLVAAACAALLLGCARVPDARSGDGGQAGPTAARPTEHAARPPDLGAEQAVATRTLTAEEIGTLVTRLDEDPYRMPGMGMHSTPNCGFSPTMLALRDAGRVAEPRLLAALGDTTSPRTARSVVMVLGQVGGPESVSRLAQLLTTDGPEEILEGVATALGRLGDPSAGPALLRALTFADKPRARREAARALGELEITTALLPLSSLLDDPQSSVKAAAFWSLKRIARPATIPALVAEIQRSTGQRKLLLVQVLGSAGKDSIPALQQIVQGSPEQQTRGAASAMLARLVPDSLPVMTDLLAESIRSGDADVFETLGRQLVQSRHSPALPILKAGRAASNDRIHRVAEEQLEQWR